MSDLLRAVGEIVAFEETAGVAQVRGGPLLYERAVVIWVVSRVTLRSFRLEDGLLRRRQGVDGSEGRTVFSRALAHGLRGQRAELRREGLYIHGTSC